MTATKPEVRQKVVKSLKNKDVNWFTTEFVI